MQDAYQDSVDSGLWDRIVWIANNVLNFEAGGCNCGEKIVLTVYGEFNFEIYAATAETG
jgi:hypothetical protein